MKHLICIFALMICAVAASAQTQAQEVRQYDELALIGVWEPMSAEGDICGLFSTFESISFSNNYETDSEGDDMRCAFIKNALPSDFLKDKNLVNRYNAAYEEEIPVKDFFITSGNKLHLLLMIYNLSVHFIIVELTDSHMVITNYEGTSRMELKKKESSSVSELSITNSSNTEYYKLSGERVNKPKKGIHIIREGNKTEKILY